MEPGWCLKSDRFALFIVICGLLSIAYVVTHLDFADNLSIAKIRRSEKLQPSFSMEKGTRKTVPTTAGRTSSKLTTHPSTTPVKISSVTSSSRTYSKKNLENGQEISTYKMESGEEILSVRSDKNYPPYVKPEFLKSSSLQELKAKSYNNSFNNPHVVHIIHQSWKVKALPPRFVKWSKTWRDKFPDYEYKLWTDAENEKLVKTLFPWFWTRYNGLTQPVQKADAARYMYMFAHGGIYADLDDECLKNFEHLLKNYSVVFGAMEGKWYPPGHPGHLSEGYVQNSFMYSVPGHPLWLEVLDTIMKRPPSSSAEGTTGPFMLQEVIGTWRKKNKEREKLEMRIYEPKYFNPFSWISRRYPECKDVNRMTSRDIEACKGHFKDSYVIQYHAQTWGRGAGNTNRNDRRRI